MSNVSVSVIIPVYNAEDYLRECLDSVTGQTLKNIEIICVDDGSTDSSLEILKEYSERDSRVKILTQQNKFAGVARNAGMEIATGEYYVFLDSDDFFEPDLLELQYNRCKETQADMCICGADSYHTVKKEFTPTPWLMNKNVLKGQEIFSAESVSDSIYNVSSTAPWNKIFSAEFVKKNGIKFQALQRANDVYFVWIAMSLAEKITYVDKVLVHYRTGMTTNLQSNNATSPFDFSDALLAVKETLVEKGIYKTVENCFINNAMEHCAYNLKKLENSRKDAFNLLAKKMKEELIYDLDIAIHDESFFTNKGKYKSLCEILSTIKEPEISVIIPIYNVEKYLEQCLDSIINQSYDDYEIICVNDCSTDSSLEIINRYAKKYSNIVVIDKKENGGLLAARKSGVKVAKGKYITFIDSDDYVGKDFCKVIHDESVNSDADIIHFSIDLENYAEDDGSLRWRINNYKVKARTLKGDDILKESCITRTMITSLVGKACKTSIYKKAYSEMGDFNCYVGEDIFTFFMVAYYAKTYVAVEKGGLYFYRYGLGVSSTNSVTMEKFSKYNDMSKLATQINLFLVRNGSNEFYETCSRWVAERMLGDVLKMFKNKVREEDKKTAANLIIKNWHSIATEGDPYKRQLETTKEAFIDTYKDFPVFYKKARKDYVDTKPYVSVIIPCYNVEDYLRECIDSVINQTLENIEIICINDGSLDNTLPIIEEYYEKDDRISVVSRKHNGVSFARNDGFSKACGKYIYFLDSDDMIALNALEKLYNISEKDNLDLLLFGAESFYENNNIARAHNLYSEYYVRQSLTETPVSGEEMFVMMAEKDLLRASVPLQFIRKDYMSSSKILFKEGIHHEDELFSPLIMIRAKRVLCITDNLYKRRVRENSTMTSSINHKHFIGMFIASTNIWGNIIVSNNLNEKTVIALEKHSRRLFDSSVVKYKSLSENERSKIASTIPTEYTFLYKKLVEEPYRAHTIKKAQPHPDTQSGSFIVRKIKGGIKCYKEHGFVYTVNRFFFKVKRKLHKILGK